MKKYAKEYRAWTRIKYNCYSPSSKYYDRYKDKQIEVCQRWLDSFDSFLEDMGTAPSKKHVLIRIDPNKGFSLENCKWKSGNTYITGELISYICVNDEPAKQTLLVPFDTPFFAPINEYTWFLHRKKGNPTYVTARKPGENGNKIFLHHIILPPKDNYLTDHINGDGLDNRTCNLRYATHSTNGINRHKIKAKSGYQGVYLHKGTNKWAAQVGERPNKTHIGLFNTKEEAVFAYRTEARNRYGDFVPNYWQ